MNYIKLYFFSYDIASVIINTHGKFCGIKGDNAMRVLIIGGVAAGTKVAAKLKRENRGAEVLILTKSQDISYAGCGLPYYVGDVIQERSQLIVNTPQSFAKLTGAQVKTGAEVIALDRQEKQVTAVDLQTGEECRYSYDKLVIATGASPLLLLFRERTLKMFSICVPRRMQRI